MQSHLPTKLYGIYSHAGAGDSVNSRNGSYVLCPSLSFHREVIKLSNYLIIW